MEKTKFLSYGRQSIDTDDIAAVVKVLQGDFLTQGPAVDFFEQQLKNEIGCKHVIVVNSGTAALHLAYASMGLKKGDAIIVPAITFAATANAGVYCGATPVFADVDPATGLMNRDTCADAVARAHALGLTPRLIVPVHYAGRPVHMKDLAELAKNHNCEIFEDACHAIGASYRSSEQADWQKVGNWNSTQSKGAAFSFHPVKHVATGEGGAIATNCDALAESCRILRTHGITRNPEHFTGSLAVDETTGKNPPWYYEMVDLGWNYRISDILAALGASQTKKLRSFVEKRRQIADWYREDLDGSTLIGIPDGDDQFSKHSWHLFPVQIRKKGMARATLMEALKAKDIGTQVHYIPVPYLPFYKKNFGHTKDEDVAGAWAFYHSELSLPMFFDLRREDVSYITSTLTDLLI